jgi:iron complex outermembrane recepter protein
MLKHSARSAVKSAALVGVSVSAFAAAAYAQDQSKPFDLPAQSAAVGIQEFAREADVQILAAQDDVTGVQTNAVRGTLSVHEALNRLLAGTHMIVASNDGHTIVLKRETRSASAAPLAQDVMVADLEPTAPDQVEPGLAAQTVQPGPGAAQAQAVAGPVQVAQAASPMVAQARAAAGVRVPTEQVVITGSLISGTPAVGVPVTTLSDQDFKTAGALTTADLLKNVPAVEVQASNTATLNGGYITGTQDTEIHGLGGALPGVAPDTLLLVDGARVPIQGRGLCSLDPSIIPQLAVDHVDVLADGASATYGSDAIAGVINVILKRGYDGATTQLRFGSSSDGSFSESASQLFGRTWDTGDITVTWEGYHNSPAEATKRKYYTNDFTPWGLDNLTPLDSAFTGIASVGDPHTPDAAPSGFDAHFGATCDNCYAIPKGQNGVGLTWAQVLSNNPTATSFTKNEVNPYSNSWSIPDMSRESFAGTFDQRLWSGTGILNTVQFFMEGYWDNRRNRGLSAGTTGPTDVNAYTYTIPTSNPYYPAGAPQGLEVSYDFGSGHYSAGQVADRIEAGVNLDFALGWQGKVFYGRSEDTEFAHWTNMYNHNLVNAALGNTVVDSSGVYAPLTKPANVPYLNLFCDPTAFQCIDPATRAFMATSRNSVERSVQDQTDASFNGPLFDLPGGQVKAAVGGDYLTEHYSFYDTDGSSSFLGDAAPGLAPDANSEQIWAAFAQLDVPIVGQANAIPFVQALLLEVSGRIDHYSIFGSTKNPKFSLNWTVGAGLTLKAAMGTSFRAPVFTETSPSAGASLNPVNVPAGGLNNNEPSCPVVGVPAVPGSAAAVLDPNCSAALQYIGGFSVSGGSAVAAPYRSATLNPETARNWALGFDFAPNDTLGFLKGLDVNATLYRIKINGVIQPKSMFGGFDDPLARSFYILPSDIPNFAQAVTTLVANPRTAPYTIASGINFIEDMANANVGWQMVKGIDFSASYNWDMGDLGVWNTGVVGNYALDSQILTAPGTPVFDAYKGIDSGGRLNYRARLGWMSPDSAWSVTGFMNYKAHVGAQPPDGFPVEPLPPACFLVGNPACNASGLPQFAQYTQQFPFLTDKIPAFVTFDLSIGYDTLDQPANDYLKNIAVQLTVNDITNKELPFQYVTLNGGPSGSPRAFSHYYDPAQRVISLVITKQW